MQSSDREDRRGGEKHQYATMMVMVRVRLQILHPVIVELMSDIQWVEGQV